MGLLTYGNSGMIVTTCCVDYCTQRIGLNTEPKLCDNHMAEYKAHDPATLGDEPDSVAAVRHYDRTARRNELQYEAGLTDAYKHGNHGNGGY